MSDKENKTFSLRSEAEVERFEELFSLYFKSRSQRAYKTISLIKAFKHFQSHPESKRFFTALLDLHINLNLLQSELIEAVSIWNGHFIRGNLKGGTVLDSKEKFFGKMKIHQHSTGFILRYRAVWDKVMGILILIYLPEHYEDFRKAKSRKRMFVKLSKTIPQIGETFANEVSQNLDKFDQQFRTPEAHGTGSLRRWSFTMEEFDKNPHIEFLSYWNALNCVIIELTERLNIKG